MKRPAIVAVSNTSGTAGVAHWINAHYRLSEEKKVDKSSPLVAAVKEWVDKQYEDDRVTALSDNELEEVISRLCGELNITL